MLIFVIGRGDKMKKTKMNEEKVEERSIFFIWICLTIGIPLILFLIVNAFVNTNIIDSKFLADNVLIYYGTIVGACLSGAITFIGLLYTLRQNSESLKQQKKDLEENFNKQLELKFRENFENHLRESIFNLYNLKTAITALANIYNKTMDDDTKKVEIANYSKEIRLCTYKMDYFNDNKYIEFKKYNENIKKIDESIIDFMNDACRTPNLRVDALKLINEYINELKLL